ncbi:hypothetical protein PBY51_009474 [Eleginops maclovinus]|uniref:Uncharacterized protein n=1 Tax=Eleginops maclovinus TaxID=56733 RepID=A0AAN7XX17_ELEMC|nr:hypothetical protein PBY51_009474 [Eleginops maclovinus]
MKSNLVLPACLLVLWTLAAHVKCKEETAIEVETVSNGIKVTCALNLTKDGIVVPDNTLTYNDEHTGEYLCSATHIYVKFRSCDNCVEFDTATIVGLAVGDVVATIVIGVAVYVVASQTQIGPTTSVKKRSNRQNRVPNAVRPGVVNDPYQPLKFRQRDVYDQLNNGAVHSYPHH